MDASGGREWKIDDDGQELVSIPFAASLHRNQGRCLHAVDGLSRDLIKSTETKIMKSLLLGPRRSLFLGAQ